MEGEEDKSNNQIKNQNTTITAVLTAYSVSQIQYQYIPAESVLHTKEPEKCNILPSLNLRSLLSFSQGLGTIQLKYSMSLKHSIENKHATGISFAMLKDHMALQNAKVPYSDATVFVEKDVHRCWLSQECQDTLLRSLPLTGCTPCTRKSDTCQPGFPAQLQNIEQEILAHPASSGHTAGCVSATAHTQPQHRAFRRHQPPGSTRAASLMLPRVNQDGKVTPVHAFPLNTEVGDDNMLHTTSTGKVSLLLIMCPRANSAWTISYVHSKCLQQTFK